MHTTIGIEIEAPARVVFELVRDVPSWPVVLPHYRSVTVRSRGDAWSVLDMRAVRSAGPVSIPVAWRSRTWSDDSDPDDLRLRFTHVAGATRGMEVTWHIRPSDDDASCAVTIEHAFSRHVPLLGDEAFPRVVDRFFVRSIAGRTLAAFKRLAER